MRKITLITDGGPATELLLAVVRQWHRLDPALQADGVTLWLDAPEAAAIAVHTNGNGHSNGAALKARKLPGGCRHLRDWTADDAYRRLPFRHLLDSSPGQLPALLHHASRYTDLVLMPRTLLLHPYLHWAEQVQPTLHAPVFLPESADAIHPVRNLLVPDGAVVRQVLRLQQQLMGDGEVILVNFEPGLPQSEKMLVSYVQSYCLHTSYYFAQAATAAEIQRLVTPGTLLAGTLDQVRPGGRCLHELLTQEPQPPGLSYFLAPIL